MDTKEKEVYDEMCKLGYFFNPRITYKEIINLGERPFTDETLGKEVYDINTDIFAINSLYKNGENAYANYLYENLYKNLNLDETIHSEALIKNRILPFLSIRYDKKAKSRKLTYNYEFLFIKIINILQIDYSNSLAHNNYKTFYNRVKKVLDKYIEVLSKATSDKDISQSEIDFIKKTFKIDIMPKVPEKSLTIKVNGTDCFLASINNIKQLKVKDGKGYVKTNDYNKLVGIYNISQKLKKAMSNIINSKLEINLDEFFELFDTPTLYLIIAKVSLDLAFFYHKNYNIGPMYCVTEIRDYVFYILDKLGKDYNPSIKIYNNDTKEIEKYDFNNLKYELNDYLNYYPKCFDQLSDEEIEQNNIKTVEDLDAYYEKKEKNEVDTLFASWEFIKKGEAGSLNEKVKRSKPINRNNPEKEEKAREEYNKALAAAEERSEFLLNTDYSYNIIGINNFDGYEGYIYKDGTVLLEHVYSDSLTKTPCLDAGATYIMNIYNFVEFSKKSKTEIMEYISKMENPEVRRKYHSKNWKNNILKEISGKKMDIDVLLFINKMINDGTLSRLR